MKQLDTDTVLAIIKMIDTRLYSIAKDYEQGLMTDEGFYSASNALTELQDKLQKYIEGLVNQVENQMGQGE